MNKMYRKGGPGETASMNGRKFEDSDQGPTGSHVKGEMTGNMMGYKASRNPMPYPDTGYGPTPLKDPTGLVKDKTMPGSIKGYVTIDPNNSEWTTIKSSPKKKRSF